MKKILITIVALTLVLVGCNNSTEKETVGEDNFRIISLAPSITENIIGMEMLESLIAVDTYSIFEETEELTFVDAMAINVEEVLMLKPTHILVPDYNYTGDKKGDYKVFEDQDIKVISINGANSIEDIYTGIAEIGIALDSESASDKLIEETRKKEAEIVNKYKDEQIKTVYMEIAPAPDIYTVAKKSFTNEMIELVNGKNIFDDIDDDYFTPSVENIVERNPEVIITNVSYIDNPLDEILKRAGFNTTTAVKNNDVYQVDADSTSRPSYKYVEGLEELAKAIHNEK